MREVGTKARYLYLENVTDKQKTEPRRLSTVTLINYIYFVVGKNFASHCFLSLWQLPGDGAERKASRSGLSHLIMTTHQKCIWPTCGVSPPFSSACRRCQKTQQKKRKNTTTNPKMISHSKVKKVEKNFFIAARISVCLCVCRLGIKCRWRFMAIGSSSPWNGNGSWGPAEAKCSN